jgi:hypothetical protein
MRGTYLLMRVRINMLVSHLDASFNESCDQWRLVRWLLDCQIATRSVVLCIGRYVRVPVVFRLDEIR